MYYRLKQSYVLRGWEGLAWVLVKRPCNQIYQLSQEEFQVLILCDGETELSNNLLDITLEKNLRRCIRKGWIEICEKPYPLEKDQYYQYHHNRYVDRIFWSITGKCNFHCRHCYMDAPDEALGELSTTQAMSFIDQMAECGVLKVDITGGEPFIRKDFWQLVDQIISYKMTIGAIHTNGWLLDESVLNKFEQRGLKPDIVVSFDGIGWHDWMRGVEGAEKAALRALELCHQHGFYTSVGMCIHQGSLSTIPQTVEKLSSIGVESIKISNVEQTELWRRRNEGNDLSWSDFIEAMISYIPWYYKAGRPIKQLILGNVAELYQDTHGVIIAERYDGTEKCLNCYLCDSARWSCYIAPDGRLLPCMAMTASSVQNKFPRVQDIGLKQGLSSSYFMRFINGRIRDLMAANPECNACAYRYKCGGGCRALATIEFDCDLMGCDRTMCMLWKNGYIDRIRKAIDEAEAKYGSSLKA